MSDADDDRRDGRRLATRLVRAGRDRRLTGPFVNPPVVHASTVLFDTVEEMETPRQPYVYGRRGTPTSDALETAIADLEGAAGTVLCPSGLSAAATALLSCLSAGERLLMVDSVYGPVRHFAQTALKRFGVEARFFDPLDAESIDAMMTEPFRAVYLEAPGSLTFEMVDVSAIAAAAKQRGATVLFDNTWATPARYRPLDHGVDLAIVAGTKYVGGHSDVMLGTIAATADHWPRLKEAHGSLGLHVAPDDVYLALRGLRTLDVRLTRHSESALAVATWLAGRPEVARVLYPPLPIDPGHLLWERDMAGAGGLMGVVLSGWSDIHARQFIDSLSLFGIGASWGGFESLAILAHPAPWRSATKWRAEGPVVRLFIGLEDPDDLIADLAAAFARVGGPA